MTLALKIYLWIILVVNSIIGIIIFLPAFVMPLLWFDVIYRVVIVGGAIALLNRKKVGFYMICGVAVVSCIIYIGASENIIAILCSSIPMPLITYLLMRKGWYYFD